MATFLEKYVRGPINSLMQEASEELPDFTAQLTDNEIRLTVGGESLVISRDATAADDEEIEGDAIPEDVSDELPG